MYSFSLKFSLYICSKFPGKGQALSFIGHLHLIVKDLLRLFPKMKGYDKKEGSEKDFYQGRKIFRTGRQGSPKTNSTDVPGSSSAVDGTVWSS